MVHLSLWQSSRSLITCWVIRVWGNRNLQFLVGYKLAQPLWRTIWQNLSNDKCIYILIDPWTPRVPWLCLSGDPCFSCSSCECTLSSLTVCSLRLETIALYYLHNLKEFTINFLLTEWINKGKFLDTQGSPLSSLTLLIHFLLALSKYASCRWFLPSFPGYTQLTWSFFSY